MRLPLDERSGFNSWPGQIGSKFANGLRLFLKKAASPTRKEAAVGPANSLCNHNVFTFLFVCYKVVTIVVLRLYDSTIE